MTGVSGAILAEELDSSELARGLPTGEVAELDGQFALSLEKTVLAEPRPDSRAVTLTPAQILGLTFAFNRILTATQGPKPKLRLNGMEAERLHKVSGGASLNVSSPKMTPFMLTHMLALFRLLDRRGVAWSGLGVRQADVAIVRDLIKDRQLSMARRMFAPLSNRRRRIGMYAALNQSLQPTYEKKRDTVFVKDDRRVEHVAQAVDPKLSTKKASRRRMMMPALAPRPAGRYQKLNDELAERIRLAALTPAAPEAPAPESPRRRLRRDLGFAPAA